ncbi:tRNA lysidine(34) synthetase TilS, partial [Ralstonia pseudosolanacearum]
MLLVDKVAQRVVACAAFVVSGGAPTVARSRPDARRSGRPRRAACCRRRAPA